jgi:ArsR family metal-binding transcriptional regulator
MTLPKPELGGITMTLDEAIKHAEEVADEKKKEACNLYDVKNYEESRECIWCSEEHRQLADWLKDYKRLKEQQPCKDTIRRTEVMKVLSDFVTLEKYIDKHNHITFEPLEQMINMLPSVNPESKIVALLEKTYADFCRCEGGEGWLKIDGKEYSTDAGYALEGMRIFMEVFRQRLAESEEV